MSIVQRYYATGRRKSSVARVWVWPGDGSITVNRKPMEQYFPRATSKMIVRRPFEVTETLGNISVLATVKGGGLSGQAGALQHGISRALENMNKDHRPVLKKGGFLTRDPREKERKKYGLRGARARFQYSKR